MALVDNNDDLYRRMFAAQGKTVFDPAMLGTDRLQDARAKGIFVDGTGTEGLSPGMFTEANPQEEDPRLSVFGPRPTAPAAPSTIPPAAPAPVSSEQSFWSSLSRAQQQRARNDVASPEGKLWNRQLQEARAVDAQAAAEQKGAQRLESEREFQLKKAAVAPTINAEAKTAAIAARQMERKQNFTNKLQYLTAEEQSKARLAEQKKGIHAANAEVDADLEMKQAQAEGKAVGTAEWEQARQRSEDITMRELAAKTEAARGTAQYEAAIEDELTAARQYRQSAVAGLGDENTVNEAAKTRANIPEPPPTGQPPATPTAQPAPTDTNKNGVPDAEEGRHASALNFMTRYEAMLDTDPRKAPLAAKYDKAKMLVQSFRAKYKESLGTTE